MTIENMFLEALAGEEFTEEYKNKLITQMVALLIGDLAAAHIYLNKLGQKDDYYEWRHSIVGQSSNGYTETSKAILLAATKEAVERLKERAEAAPREAIEKAIASIEKAEEYDNRRFFYECGTPASIPGHLITTHLNQDKYIKIGAVDLFQKARDIAGLTQQQALQMFDSYPFKFDRTMRPSKRDAIDMLKRFLKTGEIEWKWNV